VFDFLGVFVGLLFQIIPIAIIVLIVVWFVNRNRSKRQLASRKQRLDDIAATQEDMHMKAMMLEQMNAELEQSVHTDTMVIIVGMVINAVLFGVNTGVAAASHQPEAGLAVKLIFFVLTAFLIVLNVSLGYALASGKKKRVKITERLEKFWEDEGLGKYQDASFSSGYATRGNLFTFILLALGVVALLVSLIAYFVGF
jgi:purine-cytosine permease-like protein